MSTINQRCGNCKHFRPYDGEKPFCDWPLPDNSPLWIVGAVMYADSFVNSSDGQLCPAWQRRDD